MAERSHIPASPACGQWETLLADALDGLLRPEDQQFFNEHKASCPSCTALYEEAMRGREWLDFLSMEPEVPEGLLEKILTKTGPGLVTGISLVPVDRTPALAGEGLSYRQVFVPAWQKPGFMGFVRRFAEPRLLMTVAMAFFSIGLTLNLLGIRIKNLDLRPTAVRSYMQRQLAVASTPIIRYYDHLRLVYEVQTRMKELRRETEGQQQSAPAGGESKQTPKPKSGGSMLERRGLDPGTALPQESNHPTEQDMSRGDLLETSFNIIEKHMSRHEHFGGSHRKEERSTKWIA